MYQSLAGMVMTEEQFQKSLAKFTHHDELSRSKMVLKTGAREFLVAARNQLPLVVVTGTPQPVIDETIRTFGLEVFFREVCGSPQGKAEHLRHQLKVRNLNPDQALYVGDALHDFESSYECNIPFVGIDNGDHPFDESKIAALIPDLGRLIPLLGLG
jgi:phosphoglycolate phosphatase-like HAD superfamily hydrolase